ncbi:hypothetical protein F0L68_39345 [Solihabitans fulvus]|uniref:Mobilisation protein (MobC) n=1 Tax=Solihabitans fulvus TaxID=1892852 RepID=A0A5B2WF69_9PSEU|nr:hypothetical protein [Solihabitans fulvus]KAA2249548.1 hypothetical protein F0L68_39345 [Solihabitans fulvus]
MAANKAGYRRHAASVRSHEVKARFNDAELVRVVAAAQRDGLKPGAWVAQAATRAARVATGELRPDWAALQAVWEELRQLRWLAGNLGGNLNDVARHANTTGEIARHTAIVLGMVRRLAARLDTQLDAIDRELRP